MSTVSREVKRGGGRCGYSAWHAHERARDQAPRPKPFKLASGLLLEEVASWQEQLWSPEEIAARLHCGMVAVNGVISFAAIPALPFGGVGDSGFGRIHGEDGLREFTTARGIAARRFPSLNVMDFDRPSWAVRAMAALTRMLYGRKR